MLSTMHFKCIDFSKEKEIDVLIKPSLKYKLRELFYIVYCDMKTYIIVFEILIIQKFIALLSI